MNKIKVSINYDPVTGKSEIEKEAFGIHVEMSDGAKYHMIDRDGNLDINLVQSNPSGSVAILPKASNLIQLKVESW